MEVFSGGEENIMETRLNLLSSREVEAGGQRRGVMDRMKQVPGWVAGVTGTLLGSTQPGYAMLTLSAPPACPPSPQREWKREERRG